MTDPVPKLPEDSIRQPLSKNPSPSKGLANFENPVESEELAKVLIKHRAYAMNLSREDVEALRADLEQWRTKSLLAEGLMTAQAWYDQFMLALPIHSTELYKLSTIKLAARKVGLQDIKNKLDKEVS